MRIELIHTAVWSEVLPPPSSPHLFWLYSLSMCNVCCYMTSIFVVILSDPCRSRCEDKGPHVTQIDAVMNSRGFEEGPLQYIYIVASI